MTVMQQEQEMKSGEELEKLVDKALRKVKGNKENDLCKFLPGPSGGYMHHFTLRKIKNNEPKLFFTLLQKFILDADTPKILDPKPRAPRGTRKRREAINFTRTDIERVLELAKRVGDKDLMARFSPKRTLPALKRELIRSIREGHVNNDLWSAYAEAMATIHSTGDNF